MSTTAIESRRWPMAIFLIVLALSVLKGLRMPNRWSITHYLFGYDFGFVRRGLWGEAIGRVLGGWSSKYFVLAAVALVILAALIAILTRMALRLAEREDWAPVALVFLASPAIAMLAHLVGYLEQIGYLWLVALIAMRGRRTVQIAVALSGAAVLPFVHEASLLWFAPLSMLLIVTGAAGGRRFVTMWALAFMWVASTGAVLWLQRSTTTAQVLELRDERTRTFDIRPRQDAFSAIVVPLDHAYADMRRRWSESGTRLDMVASVATFAPSALLLALVAVRRARAFADAATREVTLILIGLAVAAPLLLHVVAWDQHRWNGLVALNAGIAALIVARSPAEWLRSGAPARTIGAWVALGVAIWSLAGDPVFFDGYSPAHPPFIWHVQFLLDFARTGDWGMWIPAVGN